jgi:hypothetical protein
MSLLNILTFIVLCPLRIFYFSYITFVYIYSTSRDIRAKLIFPLNSPRKDRQKRAVQGSCSGRKDSGSQKSSVESPRLSRHVSWLKPEYDVVVIGSGYGGGTAASRMARSGKRICVLERGEEKWPGEYPHTFKAAMWDYRVSGCIGPKDLEIGKRTGLYHTVKGKGQDVFVGQGLGGTSLINGNVFLRADYRTLGLREWPSQIREEPEVLDKCMSTIPTYILASKRYRL